MGARRSRRCAADFLVYLMANGPAEGAEPRRDAPEKGQTLPSRDDKSEPRLPHERDESADSHPGTQDERVAQAARDLAQGQQDTGRSPVVTELAEQEFPVQKSAEQAAEKKTNP